ncbi:protein of unknown function, DUF4124-containing [Citrifermentans bemidjiense Bem]|uniref:DUF4124 domain-containing protein n=1 Tax=Citrifermentans bemidjiense (strain ATCC BAA-1014 / DSM 16622 / JCM 12645 / Bem) TaxID=404380 RepID=B5EHC4_CITBB|nr:DUF4124 domain-containing protein [Citrifermentans bemidjiense]ACH39660.1 protein of unknown function, DUF4124-containing [Citrifermentans bemidjiense Bem]
MKKLLLLLLLLYPLSALAETYEWTDERGTVNFAEDLGKVPKKYRKKAKRLGSEEPPAAASETASPKGGEEKGAKNNEKSNEKSKTYGGKDELAWRREFQQANSRLQSAQTELDTLKSRLADTSRMSRSDYLMIQNSIKHNEARMQELQKKLDQLNSTADRYDVPADFRK